jgi:tetratricopeptide (TPR) repeat protein
MNLNWRLSHTRGYLALGMLAEAEAELNAADAGGGAELPEVRMLRVALLHEKQDWPALRTLARALVETQPEEAGWWVSLAFATRRASSLAEARTILLEAESRHRDEAIIQFNLACYAAQIGAIDEARERIRRAIDLNEAFRELARHDPDLDPLRAIDPEFPGPIPARPG